MTSKNNRVHFLYYIKLCALFQIHRWIQTGVILRRRQITVKIGVVCPVWPWKLTDDLEMDERDDLGHLFNSNSSFVHHSIAINESKLELLTGNTQFGSKSMIFLFRVALKFQKLSWKTIGHIVCATSNFAYNFIAIGQIKLELQSGNAKFGWKSMIFVPCDLKVGQMTFKNNRSPLLCYFKLCASFHNHQWNQME